MELVIRRVPNWDGTPESVLAHHGIKGQKWGVRRYQNPDGSLTSAGKVRYGSRGKYGSFMDDYSSKAKAYGQAARETASRYGAAAKDTATRYGEAARTATNPDVIASRAQFATSNFDTSTRRASNLGETGTGVRHRSRLGSHSSLSVSDDLSSIKPAMRMKGKDFCDNLLDKDVQELRDREMVQIGRFYTEKLYKGHGSESVSSSIHGLDSKAYARQGMSITGGESGHYMSRGDTRNIALNRVEQDRTAEFVRRYRSGELNSRINPSAERKREVENKIDELNTRYNRLEDEAWDRYTDPKRKNLSKRW